MKSTVLNFLMMLFCVFVVGKVNGAPTLPVVNIGHSIDPNKDSRTTEQWQGSADWTVTRSGSTSAALTVNYGVSGTATAGVDYRPLSGSVIIPAGSAQADIETRAIPDSLVEGEETIILTLEPSANYVIGTSKSATCLVTDNPPPQAPSNLSATETSSGVVDLTWLDNSKNETGFKVERKIGSGGTYVQIATPSSNVTSYQDLGLSTTKQTFYRIMATNAAGDSAYSNEAILEALGVKVVTPPAAPTGLTVATVSSSQINLSWVDNSSREDVYKIERATGASGVYSEIATVAANGVTYSDTGLASNTSYSYRVRASSTAGDSAYSNIASASTLDVVPVAPGGLVLTVLSSSQIQLGWTDRSNNETGFKIERRTGTSGAFAEIATVGANGVAYNDTGLSASTQYSYRVRATNAVGNSAYSNLTNATTSAVEIVSPIGLTSTVVSSSKLNLAWTDRSNNETGFKIERATGSGSYAQIATVGKNVVRYSDTGLTPNTLYNYRVRATNLTGDSAYSNETGATTLDVVPLAPAGLSLTAVSSTEVNLTWKDGSANETSFKIERKTGLNAFRQIATVGANVTTFSNTGLAASTRYIYRVRAANAIGNSPYSNQAAITTPKRVSTSASSVFGITAEKSSIAEGASDNSESADLFLNPFNSDSAHHRPIGKGAIYASSTDPSTKSWLTAKVISLNVGVPWGLYMADSGVGGPVLNVKRRPGTKGSGLPVNVRFPVGGVKINTDGRDGNFGIFDRVTNILAHLRQYSWNNGNPVAGQYRSYDLVGLGHGTRLNNRVGTSASGVASPFGILRGWEVNKKGHPIGHALQIVLPRVLKTRPNMLSREVWWPAVGMDSSAYTDRTANTGNIPYGGLLALLPVEKGGPDLKKLGLSEKGLRLAECIRDYGMYVVDGNGGNPAIRADQNFDIATIQELQKATQKFYRSIRLVVNSVPEAGKVKYNVRDAQNKPTGGPNKQIIPGQFPAGGGAPLAPNTAWDVTGRSVITFKVSRSGSISKKSVVNWSVDFAGGFNATDLMLGHAFDGQLEWNAGEASSKTIQIGIRGDAIREANENCTIRITGVTNATIPTPTASTTVLNDD